MDLAFLSHKFLYKYNTPASAKGRCHIAVSELADYFRSIGEINFKVYNVRVRGVGKYHILLKKDGLWFDPTGVQYGQPQRVFSDKNIPKIYKPNKQLNPDRFTIRGGVVVQVRKHKRTVGG